MPDHLLAAIGHVESGRLDPRTGTINPWPWTINAQGQDGIFETKADAIAAVRALQARNIQSIDVGCMQVNLMYHPQAFATLDDAFDPASNVRYAAHFLNQLFARTGSWPEAAAMYHSATPDIGLAYQRKVLALWPYEKPVRPVDTLREQMANAWAATLQPASGSGTSANNQFVGFMERARPARLQAPRPPPASLQVETGRPAQRRSISG